MFVVEGSKLEVPPSRGKGEYMRSLIGSIVVSSILAGLMPAGVAAQSSDLFVGTWKMNAAKSTFTPGPGPKSVTVVIVKEGSAYKVTSNGVDAQGKATHTEYTAMTDGKDYPVVGSPDYDAVTVKMLDPSTRHMVRKRAGKEAQVVHSVVAKDGKHFTSTTTGTNAKGDQVKSVIMYDKQ